MIGPIAMIHQLSKMPATTQLIAILQRLKVRTVSIQVLVGREKRNQIGGNDKSLLALRDAVLTAGMKWSGWGYTMFDQPGAQGDDIMERCEKLDFTSFLINPEKEWVNVVGGPKAAKLLMDKFKVRNFEVGFCSYRYPSIHPMPYLAFLNHEAMDFIAPQVYWIDAHNPAQQLERSVVEYRAMSDLPIIPIASTFPQGNWAPTASDLSQFIGKVKSMALPTWGFFDLDALLTREDWMDAIASVSGGPDVPPPIQPPYPGLYMKVTSRTGLKKRSTPIPDPTNANVVGAWPYGTIIQAVNVGGSDSAWVKSSEGPWGCVQIGSTRYMEPV